MVIEAAGADAVPPKMEPSPDPTGILALRQAYEDVEKIQVTGSKITQQFLRIESAELDQAEPKPANVVELREENKGS